jgi:predicted AAA+ superfamily ATPase
MVFLALRRRWRDICYYDGDGVECDFIVRNRHAVQEAVQACTQLTDESRDRELDGLLAALDSLGLESGTIVTETQRDTLEMAGHRIDVIPFAEWALSLSTGMARQIPAASRK